jgi:adenylate cyclase
MREQRRLAAIVSADVAGYSRLMGRDESGTLAALKTLRREIVDPQIAAHGGRIVKTTGDGLLLEFPSVVDAVRCVIEVQTAMAARMDEVPQDRRIAFRIGVNIGDIIIDEDDIFGDGVNIAARLQEIAAPGGVCVSSRVNDDIRDRLDTTFEDGGAQTLKNISRPVQVWRWSPGTSTPAEAALVSPADVQLTLPDKPSIAVLPFQNMSGDPEQEYFSDGMTEDIITELSRFHDLFVIARNSVFAYKGRPVDVRQVAKDLGVQFVLEGSIRKVGNRIRATGQLIDALNGAHLWAERYDRLFDDVFAVQEELTRRIASVVAPTVRSADFARIASAKPTDLKSYGIAQKARFVLARAGNKPQQQARDEATDLARRSLEIDPDCVAAMNILAHCHWWNSFYGTAPFEESLRMGLEICQRAVTIDARNHETYLYRGMLLAALRESEQAIAELRWANELNPNDAVILGWLGWAEACDGQGDVGTEHLLACLRHDPKNPEQYLTYVGLSMACFVQVNHEEGLKWARKARAAYPDFPPSIHQTLVHNVGLAHLDEAKRDFALLNQIAPDYVRRRVRDGFRLYKRIEDHERNLQFLKVAAGLESTS